MRILVDMDDVLEQLVQGWTAYMHDRYGTTTTAEDVHDWDMTKAFPGLSREQVYGAVDDDTLWDYVKPMPGAPEALKKLMDDGHEVYIVTATDYRTLCAKMDKVLFRYFPFLEWQQVIITRNKHLIKGDILIDDGPHNMQGGDYRKILYSANHNLDFDEDSVNAIRCADWNEVLSAVERIRQELEDTNTEKE